MTKDLRVNADRMLASFNQLALIGATTEGGVNRPALSEAHLVARKWFREEVERSGLEFHTDGAGNHSAFLPVIAREQSDRNDLRFEEEIASQKPLATLALGAHLPRAHTCPGGRCQGVPGSAGVTLMLGSHLDSVPDGGRFDGALGVVAALEVMRTIRENGIQLRVNLEAMDFTDEEGTLVGLLGSAALAGHLTQEMLQSPRGGRENLFEGMQRARLSDESMLSAARPKDSLAGYLELHIEQGQRLERAGINIGIVSAIVGIWSYRLSFIGRADHAGTTTMDDRLDASLGASAFTLAARELVIKDFPNCVVNVGKMDFVPGAFNIVPARVDLSLEFRSPDEEEFNRLDAALLLLANTEATRFSLELKIEFLGKHSPSLMSETVQQAYVEACDDLGLTHVSLTSGAGHDGQSLADLCPVGMIFVPSVGGTSHSPREFTRWEDCVSGANVLLQAALRLGT